MIARGKNYIMYLTCRLNNFISLVFLVRWKISKDLIQERGFRKVSKKYNKTCRLGGSYQIIVVAGNLSLDGSGHGIVDFGCPTPSCACVNDGCQNLRFHTQPERKRSGKWNFNNMISKYWRNMTCYRVVRTI